MLAYLTGVIQTVQPDKKYLIVVVNQLGYKVFVPATVLEQCTTGSDLELYLHEVIREDTNDLYGFLTQTDLAVFEQLISVSGVGPKVGLALLSALSADAIVQAISQGDRTLLTQISGVGKKIADRLIVELKTMDIVPSQDSPTQAIVEALQQLGYSTVEIRTVLQQLDRAAEVEQQLKQALALLSHG
ncbi:MAG: Holliday junction DNA helicase RuvA [uncultured bacterium]|nr:MAG: Holliday junction DNA helicase RuvA [uncultured bacterium]HBY73363.1 Holliday junction branch migration protein RuvA [Candidatus Kerfeldbacteria bacterium]